MHIQISHRVSFLFLLLNNFQRLEILICLFYNFLIYPVTIWQTEMMVHCLRMFISFANDTGKSNEKHHRIINDSYCAPLCQKIDW